MGDSLPTLEQNTTSKLIKSEMHPISAMFFLTCLRILWLTRRVVILNFPSCDRYYSMYGHVEKLAEEIKKGAASVEGVEAKLWQVYCTCFSLSLCLCVCVWECKIQRYAKLNNVHLHPFYGLGVSLLQPYGYT